MRDSAPKPKAPNLPFQWRQGEHLTIIGDTGSGKTTLGAQLLTARQWTIAFRSKADDTALPGKYVRTATSIGKNKDTDRFLLDPVYDRQAFEFWHALNLVWKEGGWCAYLDELWYLSRLGLERKVEQLLTQGRSKGITVMTGMQRPVQVTRFAMSQSTHLIAFSCEGRDLKVLAEAGNYAWAEAVRELPRYHFAWYYRPTRTIWAGKVQDLV